MGEESAHEFGALNTLLLVVILGLCILSAYLIKQNSFYYLPDSAAAIVVGAVVGGLARLFYPSVEELQFLTFETELFFFLLLPPIIFEAGYSLKKKDFFTNFGTISVFAVFGTIISAFVIGYLVYWTGLLGLVDIDASSPIEALIFGSLISSVDPVATLSIMGNPELNCDPLLYSLVFGESVLNDAVAIVLFKTFLHYYESGAQFSMSSAVNILVDFSAVSLGSVVIGAVTALCCSYLHKHAHLRNYPEYEISLLFLFAYGSYSLAESVSLSGIMSLFFCGIFLSHYNSYNLSPVSQITAHNIFKSMAVLSEYFVFLYIGMGLFTGKLLEQVNVLFFILCLVFCLLSRFCNIFPLSFLCNCFRQQPIPLKMQTVIWFAGLRGAIAFALSQAMPHEHRRVYVSTTLLLVISTTIICGGLTEPMLSKMGMRSQQQQIQQQEHAGKCRRGGERAGDSSPSHNYEMTRTSDPDEHDTPNSRRRPRRSRHSTTGSGGSSGKSPFHRTASGSGSGSAAASSAGSGSGVRGMLQRFDEEYMYPIFGGPPQRSLLSHGFEQDEDDDSHDDDDDGDDEEGGIGVGGSSAAESSSAGGERGGEDDAELHCNVREVYAAHMQQQQRSSGGSAN